MKIWCTKIKAIDPLDGIMKTWCGDNVYAPTEEGAKKWCKENKGYLEVDGQLVAEIPCKKGTLIPDFDNMIDYE